MPVDKFRSVRGKAPVKKDMADWPAEKILALIKFTMFFMKMGEKDGRERTVFDVTGDKVDAAKISPEPFFDEFIVRVYKKDMKLNTFRMKLLNVIKSTIEYLHANPHVVTQEIEQVVKGNIYWERCLSPVAEVPNNAGGTSIVPSDPSVSIEDMKTPMAQYHAGLLKLSSVFQSLLKGINQTDINKMSAEKRIRIANNLLHSLSKAVTAQNNTKVFNTIVLNKAGREDLEKSILDYSENQNITEQ